MKKERKARKEKVFTKIFGWLLCSIILTGLIGQVNADVVVYSFDPNNGHDGKSCWGIPLNNLPEHGGYHLPANEGYISYEDEYDHLANETQDGYGYYINSQWPDNGHWEWDGIYWFVDPNLGNQLPPGVENHGNGGPGLKVLVYAPWSGKSAVAVIGDSGPAPWTGRQFGVSNKVFDALTLPEDYTRSDDKLFSRGNPNPEHAPDSNTNPEDYPVIKYADNPYWVEFSWADQNLPPGPVRLGSGTEENPYIITDVYELQEMNDHLEDPNVYFELGNDIDAYVTETWNEDPCNLGVYFGFISIGGWKTAGQFGRFEGHFDGKGHEIRGLFIKFSLVSPYDSCVGLFGCTGSGSEIQNVRLTDAQISGTFDVGALVGSSSSAITNCYVEADVSGDCFVGGLVGRADGGSITSSCFHGSVSALRNNVGGLVGHNFVVITDCYSTASVIGIASNSIQIGGLIGANYSLVTNCYSTGNVSGDNRIAGLIGFNSSGHITKCYSTGNVSGDYDIGGFIGYSYGGTTYNDCYWDVETSGQDTSAGGTGKTTAEMKQEATFTNWNFINIWDMIEGLVHPYLNPRIFSGKGMWIWKLWETENGDVAKIIQKLNSANVNWVTIKLGDGDSFWTTPNLTPERINQFHDAGIKVLGWQYVYGDDPVGEANVANQILDTGVDGFIINAEGEYEGRQDNAITYLENIRIEHPDSSIAYSTFARVDSHEEFPYKEFGRYCDFAMPQTYWKDRPTTPTNEVAEMHSQWSDLYESWEGTEYSSSIKPIIPMGQSYSDLHGYCSGSEIIEFCDALYDYGYKKASIWRYDTMTDETRDAYTISFNEVLIAALSPVELVVTDPDGLTISKELNEIPRATYLEYDINGDDELDDIVAIPKRKIGDYLTQVIPEPNVLPTDTYSLEAALEAATEDQTMVIAEDVQVQDIPEDPYEFESKLCYSDFDGDVDVDFVDYAVFVSHWFEQDCNYPAWCEGTDLDYSGSIDFNDLAIFTEHWLWPNLEGQGDEMGGMGGSSSQ